MFMTKKKAMPIPVLLPAQSLRIFPTHGYALFAALQRLTLPKTHNPQALNTNSEVCYG